MIDEKVHRIAQMYQKATGIGLPFSGTTEDMMTALDESFRKEQEKYNRLLVKQNQLGILLDDADRIRNEHVEYMRRKER